MLEWIGEIKSFIDLTPEQRQKFVSYALLVGAIIYLLYDSNDLKAEIKEKEAIIRKCNEDCQGQIIEIRRLSEGQFSDFVIKKNFEQDSIYTHFTRKIRKSLKVINHVERELDELKKQGN